MKNHIKSIVLGLIVLGLMASCKKNYNTDGGGTADGQGFSATIEQSTNASSKTHGINVDDNQVKVVWNDADLILVSNHNGDGGASQTLTYQLTEGKDEQKGYFYTSLPHDDFFHPDYAAIYPAKNTAETSNNLSGTSATFNIPDTQPYAGSEIFASKTVPMVAYSSDQTLQFKNACGGLRFPMVGSNLTVKRVELTTNTFNTSDHLCGQFTVDCTSIDPIIQWQSGGSNTITIDCGEGVTLGSAATYFYFMLPPGTLHGLRLTAYDNANNIVYNVTSTQNYVIERNKIKKVDTNLEVEIVVTTTSPTYITSSSAKGGVASVTNGTPTEIGVWWNTSPDSPDKPTDCGNYAVGTTIGAPIDMGLTAGTVYYVRAYAKSATGKYYYGDAIKFAARGNYTNGKLPGAFSTGSGTAYFSKGNLQCKSVGYDNQTMTWEENCTAGHVKWRYAENQFDFIGGDTEGTVYHNGTKCNNNHKNADRDEWFDMYSWGTSGYAHNVGNWTDANGNSHPYQRYPWVKYGVEIEELSGNSQYQENYALWAYRQFNYNLNHDPYNADWAYNKISNGLTSEGITNKYTPAQAEMNYIVSRTNTPSLNNVAHANFAFVRLKVQDNKTVNGLLLFPDSYTWPTGVATPKYINEIGNGSNPYFGTGENQWTTVDFSLYTEAEWSLLEKAGMVFLPCGGCWGSTKAANEWNNRGGRYWTRTYSDRLKAYEFRFSPDNLGTNDNVIAAPQQRKFGFCVRLLIK